MNFFPRNTSEKVKFSKFIYNMAYKELELSVTNLKSIHFDIYTNKQFRLIAGNSEMTILSILADIISPRISKCHEIDPNMELIYLSKDKQSSNLLSDDIQNILKKLLSGEKVEINYDASIKLRWANERLRIESSKFSLLSFVPSMLGNKRKIFGLFEFLYSILI